MIKQVVLDMFKREYSYIQVLTFLIASSVLTNMLHDGKDGLGWTWFAAIFIFGSILDLAVNFIFLKDDSTD